MPPTLTFIETPAEVLRRWQAEGADSDTSTDSDSAHEQREERAPSPIAAASRGFHRTLQEAHDRLHQVYNGPIFAEVSEHLSNKCIAASSKLDDIHQLGDGFVDLTPSRSNVRGMMKWALEKADTTHADCQTILDKAVPPSPDENFRLLQRVAGRRLNGAYTPPVAAAISPDAAARCFRADLLLELITHSTGRTYLAFNEANIRRMMKWALKEAGMNRVERDDLIRTMEQHGLGPLPMVDLARIHTPDVFEPIGEAGRVPRTRDRNREGLGR